MKYKLNGLRVTTIGTIAFVALDHLKMIEITYIAENIWSFSISGTLIGFFFCFVFYFHGKFFIPRNKLETTLRAFVLSDFDGKKNPSHMGVDDPSKNSFGRNFFRGFIFNPR